MQAAGHRDPDLLLAGLLHDASKGPTVGLGPRVSWSLGERYGAWVWRVVSLVPGYAAALRRLRDHAADSAQLALDAGCSAVTADLIRNQARPLDRGRGAGVARRRRGQLSVVAIAVTPGTSMRIAPDTRPDRAAHVHLDAFDGPLAALLTLIEQRQLDVLDVPLGELAGAFLEALATLPDQHLPHISAFVSVAAQLILIKSRAMLPRAVPAAAGAADDGGLDPEAELRARLVLYRRYRDAGLWLGARAGSGVSLFHREPAVAGASGRAGARPPQEPPLAASVLVAALELSLRVAPVATATADAAGAHRDPGGPARSSSVRRCAMRRTWCSRSCWRTSTTASSSR